MKTPDNRPLMPTVESRLPTPDARLAEVRRYYDRNTPAFVAYGQGGRVGAIHRAVWAPGVDDLEGAFHQVDDRIADHVRTLIPPAGVAHIVDLGCGIGASLCYLAQHLPVRGTGITVSPVQAQIAGQRIKDAWLSDRVQVIEGDFTKLPAGIPEADAAYAIESFVHGPDPEAFFSECARLIRPGGALIICDDFKRVTDDSRATRVIERFCRGWHVNTLLALDELRALATAGGFDLRSITDLTPYLEIHRMRDRVVDVALAVLDKLFPIARTRFAHLVGGNALQSCLAHFWIGSAMAVFTLRS
jgi:ubiquinone/menaquinone biosynthesis C-methylase UbiE